MVDAVVQLDLVAVVRERSDAAVFVLLFQRDVVSLAVLCSVSLRIYFCLFALFATRSRLRRIPHCVGSLGLGSDGRWVQIRSVLSTDVGELSL